MNSFWYCFTITILVQSVVKKYHRLGGLKKKHLFPTVLGVGKSKIKVPADSVLVRTVLLPYFHNMFKWQEEKRIVLFLFMNTNLIMRASPSRPNYLPNVLAPYTITLAFHYMNLRGVAKTFDP